MTKAQIFDLQDEVISIEMLEEIEGNPSVARVDNLGDSGSHNGCYWFNVEMMDGYEVDVYVRKCDCL